MFVCKIWDDYLNFFRFVWHGILVPAWSALANFNFNTAINFDEIFRSGYRGGKLVIIVY